MELNGFKAQIMEADRLIGNHTFGLPPGEALPVYKVSDFIKKSESWVDDAGSYVIAVRSDKGLWFNWTANDPRNTAILPSVKGCNPITGQKIDGFGLESYKKKCPIHGNELTDDLYCDECGYKWAPQNYVCAPNTLWLDGLCDTQGTVRQFFFTEDMKRDVAAAMIGKENTVPAFGFAFYTPKEKRMSVKLNNDGTFSPVQEHNIFNAYLSSNTTINALNFSLDTCKQRKGGGNDIVVCKSLSNSISNVSMYSSSLCDANEHVLSFAETIHEYNKEVAVGAGAQIEQVIKRDTYTVDSWKDEPDAVMRIYFVFEDEFNQYASHGFKGSLGSMLNGIPVG